MRELGLFLNTADRQAGSTRQAPTWRLPETVSGATRCHVAASFIPRDQHVINSTNYSISWTVAGTPYTTTIEPGIYDAPDLVSELEDALNTQAAGHSVVYASWSNKIEISHASALVFDASSGLAPFLGFTADAATPQGQLNLTGARWVRILSRELSRQSVHETISSGANSYDDLVVTFPVDATRFGLVSYQPIDKEVQCIMYNKARWIGGNTNRVLDLTLVDETGRPIEPQSDWQVEIRFSCVE